MFCASLKERDIWIADRAYNHFKTLYEQNLRGVFFVMREKSQMKKRGVSKVAEKDPRRISLRTRRFFSWTSARRRTTLRRCPSLPQVQAEGALQLLTLCRACLRHRLAEEGRDGNPESLWDSTRPEIRGRDVWNAVFPGSEKAFLKAM